MKGACSSPLYFLSQECWRHSYIQCCPKMMERTALLAIYCLLMPISASPLYPSLKFGQRATSILLSSTVEHPLQLPNTDYSSSQTRESMFRAGRHADAIFTNSYRKVLGQISARKLLQSVMGKRIGQDTEQHFEKRQSDIQEAPFKQQLSATQKEERQPDTHRLRNFRVPWS
ncbi:somatoliberin isoform X5 [Engraulis encrasicolus]|uniref:somatoliberin isoform X5 n=1 Tax=Engraulis encrasicolus TaxID=184585 RepID=UPI002FD0D901